MNLIHRAIFAFALIAGAAPAFAQAPVPVPALPDTERRTSYSITASTCACNVNFALFGDSTDYQNWVEIFINGVRYDYNDATFGWTITTPSGSLATLARPITNAVLTFNNAQTGTVQIVGARRPRRTAQFVENAGVSARNLNQALTDIIAQNREIWDKTNDVTGRALQARPGNTVGLLPLPSACQGKYLGFDSTGLNPVCSSGGAGSGNVVGPGSSVDGHFALFNGTSGALLKDGGVPVASATTDTTNASNISSGTLALARLPVTFPGSSAVGNLAFWGNTAGTSLGASPTYQAGNPANSALYTVVPDPATGYTGIFNGLQLGQGAALPASQQYLGGTVVVRQGIVGTSVMPSTDTTTWQAAGVAGYAHGNIAHAGGNLVGIFGQATSSVANGNMFGGNMLATNNDGTCLGGCTNGFDANYVSGLEVNINLWKKSGGSDPVISGGHAYGITVAGSGNVASQISGSAAVVLNQMSVGSNIPWNYGVQTYDGAAAVGAQYGTSTTGNNVNSQPVRFVGRTAGAVNKTTDIHGDPNGAMIIAPDSTSTVVAHLNGIGGSTLWQTGSSFGSAKQQVPSCTTAGVITNDVSGNINCAGSLPPSLGGGVYAVNATGINFNAVGDTALNVVLPSGFTRILPFRITIDHASASISTAQFAIYTNTGAGGFNVQPATALTVTASADATANNAYTNSVGGSASFIAANLPTTNTVYFRVTTPQGSAATADVQFMYFVLP